MAENRFSKSFFKDADLYILDEPNAALDAITEYRLSVLYKELLKKRKGLLSLTNLII